MPSFLFYIMHYTRLMAEAAVQGATQISKTMYECLCGEVDVMQAIKDLNGEDFPVNVISWKMAIYYASTNSYTASAEYYQKAIRICFSRPERLTLAAIGMGILAERAALFLKADPQRHKEVYKEAIQSIKDLSRRYNDFMKLKLPETMRAYFNDWADVIKRIETENDMSKKSEHLFKLSRKIPY